MKLKELIENQSNLRRRMNNEQFQTAVKLQAKIDALKSRLRAINSMIEVTKCHGDAARGALEFEKKSANNELTAIINEFEKI